MRSSVTLRKVAEVAGCSPMVVSVVLRPNGSNVRVSPATRERVLQTASELGYRHNELARAVVTGESRMIGLLARTFEAEMPMQILCGVREVAAEHGFLMKLLQVPDEAAKAQEVAVQCAEQRLSGVVAVNLPPQTLEYLRRETSNYNIPVALLDDVPEQDWALRVECDDESGIRAAVDHLRDLGHRHLALLSGPHNSPVARRRENTFRQVIKERNLELPDKFVRSGDWWEPEINEPIVRELLQQKPHPTALLCASDWMAMAALRAIRAFGLSVPHDVSVIGFSDHNFAHFADPPLTSIHQPFQEMGQQAMRRLMQAIQEQVPAAKKVEPSSPRLPISQRSIALPTHLTIRASTGRCP